MSAKDKVIVVTGGARGIGLATVDAFLGAGARVVIGDLDESRAAEIAAARGVHALGVALDVTDNASFSGLLDVTESHFGSVDVLVNNAGIMPTGFLVDQPDTMVDHIIDINLRGVITGCRLAGQRMRASGGGVIVNVSSVAGLFGAPALATYCATKFGVVGLTEALEKEFHSYGIHVAAILPAVVNTDLSAGANYPRWMRPLLELEPEDVARAVLEIVLRRGPTQTVPRRLGLPVRASRLLSSDIRHFLERRVGLDTAYSEPDPALRAAYHRRLEVSNRSVKDPIPGAANGR